MSIDVKSVVQLINAKPLRKLEESEIPTAVSFGFPKLLKYYLGVGGEEELTREIKERAPEDANGYVLGELTTSRDFYGRDNVTQVVQYYRI